MITPMSTQAPGAPTTSRRRVALWSLLLLGSCTALCVATSLAGTTLDVVALENGDRVVLYYKSQVCWEHCEVSFFLVRGRWLVNRGCRVFSDPLPPPDRRFLTFYSQEPPLFAVGEYYAALGGAVPFLLCDLRDYSCFPCDMSYEERDLRFAPLYAQNPDLIDWSSLFDDPAEEPQCEERPNNSLERTPRRGPNRCKTCYCVR
jgi:hypothetical protein